MTEMRFAPLALLAAGAFAVPAGAATTVNIDFDPFAGGDTTRNITIGGDIDPQFSYGQAYESSSAKLQTLGNSALGNFVDPYRLPNSGDQYTETKQQLPNDGGNMYLLLSFDVGGVRQAGTASFTNTLLNSITYDLAPSAVPEPAVWAQLIAGFGLAGAGLRVGRRRRRAVAA